MNPFIATLVGYLQPTVGLKVERREVTKLLGPHTTVPLECIKVTGVGRRLLYVGFLDPPHRFDIQNSVPSFIGTKFRYLGTELS